MKTTLISTILLLTATALQAGEFVWLEGESGKPSASVNSSSENTIGIVSGG